VLRRGHILAIVLITVSVITFFSLFGTAYGEFKVEKENYDISYSGMTQVKLFGTLEDSGTLRNKITFAITNPEGDRKELSVIPSNKGYYENYLIFDRNSLLGIYEVRAYTYDGSLIGKVSFELHEKKKSVDVATKYPESFTTKQPEVSSQKLTAKETKQSIPSWIRTLAGFWANVQVSDSEFINALEFMITTGIIQVSSQEDPMVKELQDENEQLKSENAVLKSRLSSQPSTQETAKNDFKEYAGPNFYFKYPADWHGKLESSYNKYGTNSKFDNFLGSDYQLSEKLGGEGAKLNFRKIIHDLRDDLKDKIQDAKLDCVYLFKIPDEIYSCKNYTLLDSGRMTIDDKSAFFVLYTETRQMGGEEDVYQFTSWKVWISGRGSGYFIFYYDVVGEDLNRHHKIFNDIISSMKLTY